MDFQRLQQYARYDLTINRAFYRNLTFLTLITMLSITLLGFLLRWLIDAAAEGAIDAYGTGMTAMCLSGAASVLLCIYAGCIHHPLRNKQSRISVLTLPATNAEKFIWHLSIVFLGGILLLLASVIVADAFNFILSVIARFPIDRIESLTWGMLRGSVLKFSILGLDPIADTPQSPLNEYYGYLLVYTIAGTLWNIVLFIFGNSLKWRFNLVWTALALWLLNTILSVFAFIGLFLIGYNIDKMDSLSPSDIITGFSVFYWCALAFSLISGAWMMWKSWKLYCRAEVTNRLNR